MDAPTAAQLPGFPQFRTITLEQDEAYHLVCLEGWPPRCGEQHATFRIRVTNMDGAAWAADFDSNSVSDALAVAAFELDLPTMSNCLAMALAGSDVNFCFSGPSGDERQQLYIAANVIAPSVAPDPIPFRLPPFGVMQRADGPAAGTMLRDTVARLITHNADATRCRYSLEEAGRRAAARAEALEIACRQMHAALGGLLAEKHPDLGLPPVIAAAAAALARTGSTQPSKRRKIGDGGVGGDSGGERQLLQAAMLAAGGGSGGGGSAGGMQPPHPPLSGSQQLFGAGSGGAGGGSGGGGGGGGGTQHRAAAAGSNAAAAGAGNMRMKMSAAERACFDVYRRVERCGVLHWEDDFQGAQPGAGPAAAAFVNGASMDEDPPLGQDAAAAAASGGLPGGVPAAAGSGAQHAAAAGAAASGGATAPAPIAPGAPMQAPAAAGSGGALGGSFDSAPANLDAAAPPPAPPRGSTMAAAAASAGAGSAPQGPPVSTVAPPKVVARRGGLGRGRGRR